MPQKERCGAKTKSGDPCRAWAMPNGRCRMHGGTNEGAPAGNKNAVTTGEHEAIFAGALSESERAVWQGTDPAALPMLDEQIRYCRVRLRRMQARLGRLRGEDFSTTEIITENGQRAEGPVDLTKEHRQANLERIQDIEDAITRVQGRLRQLLRDRYRVADQDAEGEELKRLLERMDALADGHADDYETPEVG